MPEPDPPGDRPPTGASIPRPAERARAHGRGAAAVGAGCARVAPRRGPGRRGGAAGVVGFAAVTQVRTNQVDDTYAGLREQDLIDILQRAGRHHQRAEAEIDRSSPTRDDLQSDTSAGEAALDLARRRRHAQHPGRHGAGHRARASGSPSRDPTVRSAGVVLDMVQELRTAGAEAMQINGQVRVVAQTSFEDGTAACSSTAELVEAPYVIDVIGEPAHARRGAGLPLRPGRPVRGRRRPSSTPRQVRRGRRDQFPPAPGLARGPGPSNALTCRSPTRRPIHRGDPCTPTT
jgi:hypothetical protein